MCEFFWIRQRERFFKNKSNDSTLLLRGRTSQVRVWTKGILKRHPRIWVRNMFSGNSSKAQPNGFNFRAITETDSVYTSLPDTGMDVFARLSFSEKMSICLNADAWSGELCNVRPDRLPNPRKYSFLAKQTYCLSQNRSQSFIRR